MKVRALMACALGAIALSACSVGPDVKRPRTWLPSSFVANVGTTTATSRTDAIAGVDLTAWWRAFRDAELNSLVARAVAANPDIAIALTRLQEARAQELIIVGSALPSGELSSGAGVGTGSDNTRGRVPQTLHSAGSSSGFSNVDIAGGFDAGWELDVFGRFRREIQAADFDVKAAAKIRDAVLVSVVANVARAYIDLRGFQAQVEVARRNIETARRSLQLVQTRFNQGLTNELDVTLAKRQLSTFEAGLSPLTAQAKAAQYVIAVLIGEYPEAVARELAVARPIPAFPGRIPVGLPVSLLRRRPDIRQVEFELAAATARIGVAIADLYPRVGVTTAVGGQGGQTSSSTSSGKPITFIGGIGPSVYWPILDFGTLDAKIELADLISREVLLRYKLGILRAVQEVDEAIARYRANQSRLANLARAKVAAAQAVQLASERYDRGLTDFLNVLDAQRQEFEIQAQYVDAQQVAGNQIVSLFKALGGGWERYRAVPDIRPPLPAVVAAAKLVGTPDGPRPGPPDQLLPQLPHR